MALKLTKISHSFMRWRVALMELGLSRLNLTSATKPLPEYGAGPDPYQGIQVHDYLNVSFLRQNPYAKAASKEAINTFQKYYPETLSRKFFVNVPVVMGWMYVISVSKGSEICLHVFRFTAIKMVLPKETVKKFTVMSYGNQLNTELGNDVPKVYGGEGDDLEKIGEGLKME